MLWRAPVQLQYRRASARFQRGGIFCPAELWSRKHYLLQYAWRPRNDVRPTPRPAAGAIYKAIDGAAPDWQALPPRATRFRRRYSRQFHQKSAWGYSTPYYIAALHGCHPNYAGYLVKKGFSDEKIDEILSQISFENKTIYNIDYINTLIKSSCCIA